MRFISISLCILQVCLLSLASVSPQIHAQVFHSGQAIDVTCAHANCNKLPDATENGESGSDRSTGEKTGFCPVVLFEQGVTSVDEVAVWLPEKLTLATSILIEPDAVLTSHCVGATQARAPPAS